MKGGSKIREYLYSRSRRLPYAAVFSPSTLPAVAGFPSFLLFHAAPLLGGVSSEG